jgi:DNA mismatch repair ATPase MutS
LIPQIFASQPDGKEQGSLFKLLDKTVTAFGQRRLREWVSEMLQDCVRVICPEGAGKPEVA